MAPNRELAKQLIVEIIRQSGGNIGKTRLFKTFWLAHLFYARRARGYLSDWPIVRMPNGPGIDRADKLIDELIEARRVTRAHEAKGPFTEINCRLVGEAGGQGLSEEAIEAIKEAVAFLKGMSAEAVSNLSHDYSRSWNLLPNGAELNVYSDLIPEDEYAEQKEQMIEMKKAYEKLFG